MKNKYELYESEEGEIWCTNCGCSDLDEYEENDTKIYWKNRKNCI